MSAIFGERDTLIMNTVPRHAAPIDRALLLTPSATLFEVSVAGTPTPAAITFSAVMLGAVGEITFSSDPAVPLTVANGDAVLQFADMAASIVTVTATTVIDGLTYVARQTVAKQQALDLRPPPAPTGLATTGHPATITLAWDAAPANYSNLSHTEVWRAQVNNFAQAALAGRADGREYVDPVGPGVTRYYWIRYVSRAAIPGPYNTGSGTIGASDAEVEHLLGVLTGEITQSQLNAELGAKIDLIDVLDEAYGDTASAAVSAAAATEAAAAALLSKQQAAAAAGQGGQYASQASQSATAANADAGRASTSAGQASQAATGATGSASAAQASQAAAAQSAQGAGASAAAAADSKQGAASYANAAETASTASSAAKVSAQAARDGAADAAQAASGSAGTASAKANEAGQSAIAANNAATTATTRAADAGVYAAQAANSQTNADGSAQAAASFLQQAQAILRDPVTGLVDKYAAVKVLADATAESLGQARAKYGVQVDVDGVSGGFELIGGGGRVDFGVRASTFFIAAPAGSGIPTAVPFIVRTTETVIGGVTIPIGVYIADAFIQNASITNAKIGGDIWSSNFVAGQSGWRLYRSGDMEVNNLHARGTVTGGGFTSVYDWPTNGQGGFHLSASGLLIGNARIGGYFQVEPNGDIYTPGFRVVGRNAIFSGALAGASGTFSGNLSAVSGTLGTITAGYLQNATNTSYVSLNATGDEPFLYAGGGKIRLNADGSGAFARTIISEPNVVRSGKMPISVGWRNNTMPFTVYVDTGETFSDLWYDAPSATYIGNATLAGGFSESGGLSGYVETTVVVGGGLYGGTQTPVGQRIYLRVTWTPGNGTGRINPASIAWKLVKV